MLLYTYKTSPLQVMQQLSTMSDDFLINQYQEKSISGIGLWLPRVIYHLDREEDYALIGELISRGEQHTSMLIKPDVWFHLLSGKGKPMHASTSMLLEPPWIFTFMPTQIMVMHDSRDDYYKAKVAL